MMSLVYSFRMGHSTISKLICECCLVLWQVLEKKVGIVFENLQAIVPLLFYVNSMIKKLMSHDQKIYT